MSEDPDTVEAAEKIRLFRLWRDTGNERYLLAAQQLRGDALTELLAKKSKGRPSESGDFRLLHDEMHEAVQGGLKPAQAAGEVVDAAAGGGTRDAKARRLALKYRIQKPFIEHVAAVVTQECEAAAKVARAAEEFREKIEEERDESEKRRS
ncbi:MAG TPA: hypothetical protein VHL31_10750 [Geminicoccus sp.]|jgi:hypothetical protein|uniref:hypothetical protein n=1 Tax=Geminicoccus sp. TaxID=2024832 RepID=UPI002E364BF5|nr:hypothetical protein [Geminicoccus sp.]HEX2526759.1 hypothetical protein [Geminicoccus sp.]